MNEKLSKKQRKQLDLINWRTNLTDIKYFANDIGSMPYRRNAWLIGSPFAFIVTKQNLLWCQHNGHNMYVDDTSWWRTVNVDALITRIPLPEPSPACPPGLNHCGKCVTQIDRNGSQKSFKKQVGAKRESVSYAYNEFIAMPL